MSCDNDWSVNDVMTKFDKLGILPHTLPNAIGMWPNEQGCLVWTACQCDPNKNWLEIGSFCGGSTLLLALAKAQFVTDSKIIAIDNSFNPMFDLNVKRSKLTNIEKIQCNSEDILLWYSYECESVSFAFLDGWHSFSSIIKEVDILETIMSDDCIIAFHDTSPIIHNHEQSYIDEKYEYAIANWNSLMNSKEQDFRIDEAIVYLCKEHNYEIIDIPVRQHINYAKETGLNSWVRGTTSPYNAFTAIRKRK